MKEVTWQIISARCPECGELTSQEGESELHITPQGDPVFYHTDCWRRHDDRLRFADAEPCSICGEPIPHYGSLVVKEKDGQGMVRRFHYLCGQKET